MIKVLLIIKINSVYVCFKTSQSPTGPVIHELDTDVLLEDVLPEEEEEEDDSVLCEAETILPDVGPDSTSPATTNYFAVE